MAASKAANRRSRSSASDPADHAWQRAVRLLAAHDRSAQEIRDRLAMEGAAAAVINTTIRRLQALRYLDDRRFAATAAEQAMNRGRGSEYVRAHLSTKGIAEPVIEETVAATFTDETELARRVLAARYPDEPQLPRARAKAARFLAQRGFPEAVVLAILGEGC